MTETKPIEELVKEFLERGDIVKLFFKSDTFDHSTVGFYIGTSQESHLMEFSDMFPDNGDTHRVGVFDPNDLEYACVNHPHAPITGGLMHIKF